MNTKKTIKALAIPPAAPPATDEWLSEIPDFPSPYAEEEVYALRPKPTPRGRTLILIDPETIRYLGLSITEGTRCRVITLDPSRDGIDQVREALQDHQDVIALHFIASEDGGKIHLGSTLLTESLVDEQAENIAAWGELMGNGAAIVFWGCNMAGSRSGDALLHRLSDLTGAALAASSTLPEEIDRTFFAYSLVDCGGVIIESDFGAIEPPLPRSAQNKGG